MWSGRRRVGRRTVDRSDSCDCGRRRSASDRHRKHCTDPETQDRTRCQPCRLVVVLLLFFAHQHKAAGRKTRQDIQNYGSDVNLLCDHGVVKETAFPLCRAAAHKKAQNKRDKYSKLASTHIFHPFAIETVGTWHEMATDLTQEIGRRITTITEDTRETTLLLFFSPPVQSL